MSQLQAECSASMPVGLSRDENVAQDEHKEPVLPTWMQTSSTYEPTSDRDHFLRVNALKLTALLAHVKTQRGGLEVEKTALPDRLLGGVNVALRLGGVFVLVLCIALARNLFFVYCMLALVLVILACKRPQMLVEVLRPALGAALLAAVIMVPAVFMGQPASLVRISLKVFLSVLLVANVTQQVAWNNIIAGLRFYHVPHLVVFVLDLAIKYIVLLGEVASSVLEALTLRSVGHNGRKSESASNVMGVTFLKARDFGEELYDAMECRGFAGDYCVPKQLVITPAGIAYLCCIALTVALFGYLGVGM